MNPTQTVGQYNSTFEKNNPQYFNPTQGGTTSDPAQMAANRASIIASSNGALKEVNGMVVPANSPVGQYGSLPNSDPNKPSSSASAPQAAAGQGAIVGAVSPQNNQQPPLSDTQQWLIQNGYSEQGARNLSEADIFSYTQQMKKEQEIKNSAIQAKSDQQAIYNADLAKQNAQYSAASQKLQAQMKKDVDNAKALGYAANPYSATSSANGEGGSYGSAINQKYIRLQSELDSQAMAAKAALDSGNYQAYASINANMSKNLEAGLQDISNLSQNIQQKGVQQQQFNLTLGEKYTDDYQNALKNNQFKVAQLESMSDADILKTPAGIIAMNSNKYSGTNLTPSDIKQSLVANQKINEQLQNTAMRTSLLQEKYYSGLVNDQEMGNSAFTTTSGNKYVDGTQFKGIQFNQARAWAQSHGVSFLNKNEVDQLKNIEIARQNQTAMFNNLQSVMPEGWGQRLAQYPNRAISSFTESDSILGAVDSWMPHTIQLLRATAGTAGLRLNQSLINSALDKVTITKNDTLATAAQKMANIEIQMNTIENALMGKTNAQAGGNSGSSNTNPLGI